ncbi:MAG: LacI family DNA-binding transcriptional regulator [Bacteroidales bacterium]|nr:LacI family DNA-binding transcriptional regulator [Bacteroidales bacterium]
MTQLKDGQLRIRDIAEIANVSTGTVDRVLHNRPGVKPETKAQILKILENIDYSPNLMAKTLASKRDTRLVILIPAAKDINSYWSQPLSGVQQAIDELSSFRTVVDIYTFDDFDKDSFTQMTNRILKEKPDGVIFSPVFFDSSSSFIHRLENFEIPYAFIDANLEDCSNVAYFGQDAFRSGYTAGKLMSFGLKSGSILVLKLVNNLPISKHVSDRQDGFCKYMRDNNISDKYQIHDVEIDLKQKDEPYKTLTDFFDKNKMDGIYVPNSKTYRIAEFIEKQKIHKPLIIGYDMLPGNIKYMESGSITFLIGQRPEEQAYKAIKTLFEHIVLHKEVKKLNYSSIDIITEENIEFYKDFKNE